MTEGLKIIEGQYAFELAALLLVMVGALVLPRLGRPVFRLLRRSALYLEGRPVVATLLLAAIPMAVAAATALLIHWPEPAVHDEFAYLLAGDTFAHGRMTNPPHECWQSFETIHVLPQPTRMSKYPPGQGLALALGQVVGGTPLVGVWISIGLFCLAVHWALRSVVAPPFALLGWLYCVLRFALVDYWSQSYWGGAVAATGGALILGAAARLDRRSGLGIGIALGTGIAVLAMTRPFEGLVTIGALAIVMIWRLRRSSTRRHVSWIPLVLGASLALVPAAGFLLEYNRRVTGSAFDLPYAAFDRRYAEVPPLLFLEPYGKKTYPDPVIERFWTGFCTRDYHAQRTPRGFVRGAWKKAIVEWRYHFGVFGTAVLIAASTTKSTRRRLALPLAIAAGNGAAVLAETYHLVHYAAPAASSFIAMQVLGLAALAAWRPRGRTVGRTLVAAFVLALVLLVILAARRWAEPHTGFGERRAEIVRRLEAEPGKDLVIVSYAPTHDSHHEWVYNDADLEHSAVVFARSLDADADRRLIAAFPDRRIWRLEVDEPRAVPSLRLLDR